MALVLGRLQRTGPLVWSIPYEANLALRELGLLLFLAGVGVSAGGQLASALGEHGIAMLGLGAAVTLLTTLSLIVLLKSWVGAGIVTTLGASSGMQTQPATLAAAHELSQRSEQTYVAYATVYPVAMIGKILLAQLIALFA
jgi:putative transport protein